MIYNEFGIQIYSALELSKIFAVEKVKANKQVKVCARKAANDIKSDYDLAYWKGYGEAMEFAEKQSSRENWKLGQDFKAEETLKGQILKFIDENIIPDIMDEDLDMMAILKGKINSVLS